MSGINRFDQFTDRLAVYQDLVTRYKHWYIDTKHTLRVIGHIAIHVRMMAPGVGRTKRCIGRVRLYTYAIREDEFTLIENTMDVKWNITMRKNIETAEAS